MSERSFRESRTVRQDRAGDGWQSGYRTRHRPGPRRREGAGRDLRARQGAARLDILVNNAGAIRGGDFLKIPDEQWAGDWSLKILGYVRMARAVFPLMQAQGGGRIVNIVGAAARNPTPGYLPGGIANSGLINFTKGLADLGAPANNAVSPAATATRAGKVSSPSRRPPLVRPSTRSVPRP
jgi:NAD(P)-dependent dehydrogenase (short-subunit alcohol dehydrogenase family)